MTILDMLNRMNNNNIFMKKALDIIKDSYTNLVNDNYELTVNEVGELSVRIPSLEKRDEFVLKSAAEYPYPLLMCMKVPETNNVEKYNYLLTRFMETYSDKINVFFKDVNHVEQLKEKVVQTKNNIDLVTYISITAGAIGFIVLSIFNLTSTATTGLIVGSIAFFILSLIMQITKEIQVKKVVDAYLSLIKTEWYEKELVKQYTYLCNFVG